MQLLIGPGCRKPPIRCQPRSQVRGILLDSATSKVGCSFWIPGANTLCVAVGAVCHLARRSSSRSVRHLLRWCDVQAVQFAARASSWVGRRTPQMGSGRCCFPWYPCPDCILDWDHFEHWSGYCGHCQGLSSNVWKWACCTLWTVLGRSQPSLCHTHRRSLRRCSSRWIA